MPVLREYNHLSERYLIFVGSLCNLRCVHCYMPPGMPKIVPAWKIMLKLVWCRICHIKDIDLTGGETMLHPRIDQLVWFALFIGYREVRILTNCKAVDRAIILADKYPRLRFSISLHSHVPDEIDQFARGAVAFSIMRFIQKLGDRITYVNCCPSVYNKHFEDTPLWIHKMIPHAPICIKMLGYQTGETVPDFLPYKETTDGVRRFLQAFPAARIDFRCFGHCHVDSDLLNHPGVCLYPERNNVYDKNDWQPAVTSVTWHRPWLWLVWIFGTKRMRKWMADTIAPLVAAHHGLRYSHKCAGCIYIGECDGMEGAYFDRFGYENERAILE